MVIAMKSFNIIITLILCITSSQVNSQVCTNNRCPGDIDSQQKEHCNKYHYEGDGNNNFCPCQKGISVGYLEYPPYLYTDPVTGKPRGIWKEIIKNRVRIFCSDNKANSIQWKSASSLSGTQNSLDLREPAGRNFIWGVPIIAPEDKDETNNVVWQPLQNIEGVAFVTLKRQEWKKALDNFGSSIYAIWPFFLLAIVCAVLTGAMIWMLDTYSNKEQFPRTFRWGIYEGFWWSFVSMTTVGYGDKAPRSVGGRLFSVIWLIVGITIISILTSMLASAFTNSVNIAKETMANRPIGYIDVTTHERETIIKEHGHPIPAYNIDELERLLGIGEIHGFTMDTRQLEYYHKTRFSKINSIVFKLQKIYPYDSEKRFGMYMWNVYGCKDNQTPPSYPLYDIIAKDWDGCHHYFNQKNKRFQTVLDGSAKSTERENMDPTILEILDIPANIVDTESPVFWKFLKIIGVIILCLVIIGLGFDLVVHYYGYVVGVSTNKGYNKTEQNGTELAPITDSSIMTPEEKVISDLVAKTIQSAESKMRETENSIKFDIKNMSRAIRQEMIQLRKKMNERY